MKLYEDQLLIATTPEQAAVKGHLVIRTAYHEQDLNADDYAHLLTTAAFASSTLFEQLQARGTNIILQSFDETKIDVLARKENDGLQLTWQPTTSSPQELEATAKKIKDTVDELLAQEEYTRKEKQQTKEEKNTSAKEEPTKEQTTKEQTTKKTTKTTNYLLKKLDRIP